MGLLKSRLRRVVAAALVVGACAVGVWMVAAPAQAMPPAGWERWYFSDPNFENQVGSRTLECNGVRSGWGTTSAYSKVEWIEGCGTNVWSKTCWTRTYNSGLVVTECGGAIPYAPR